jgi:hypothetical protein
MSKTQGDEEKGIYGVSEPAVQVLPASEGDVYVDVHTKLCELGPITRWILRLIRLLLLPRA